MKLLLLLMLVFAPCVLSVDCGMPMVISGIGRNLLYSKCTKTNMMASKWMHEMFNDIKDKKMRDIRLPGSKNSGSYSISNISPLYKNTNTSKNNFVLDFMEIAEKYGSSNSRVVDMVIPWFKQQTCNFKSQFKHGIRYLDLKLCNFEGRFLFCNELMGNNLNTLLLETIDFLSENKDEVIILHFSELFGFNTTDKIKLETDIQSVYSELIIRFEDLDSMTYSDLIHSEKRIAIYMNDPDTIFISDTSILNKETKKTNINQLSLYDASPEFAVDDFLNGLVRSPRNYETFSKGSIYESLIDYGKTIYQYNIVTVPNYELVTQQFISKVIGSNSVCNKYY